MSSPITDIVAKSYIAHFNGDTVNPNTYSLKFKDRPEVRINALPAYVGADTSMSGIKWISSFPENINKGIPRASAVVILNDNETGYPIACLEGGVISAARTAASAVIGTKRLNNNITTVDNISFIGCGLISKYILDFLIGTGWLINNITLHDINQEYIINFSKYITEHYNIKVTKAISLDNAIENSEIVYFATTTSTPYMNNHELLKHNPLLINISLRDISPEIMHSSINIVDDVQHCLNANTSMHLTQIKYGHYDFIKYTIGELITSPEIKINRKEKLTIYSPFGMGILDIALGSYIYKTLMNTADTIIINDFFGDKSK